jgi:DUF4097 and DUF4098 domain-containing protein YvlB
MKSAVPSLLLVASALASACAITADSQAQIVREERRFAASGTPDVRLTTFDGSIEIQSWNRPDVVIEIEKRGATREAVEALEVKANQDGNRIELEVKRPHAEGFSGFGFHRSASAKLIVSIPRRAHVRARSGDGSISIERVNGRLELRTGDGSIRAADVGGEMTLSTGDGSVTVEKADGRLDVNTGDGGVEVSGRLGALRLHTGDGAVVFRAESGTRLEDDSEITTGDGGVTVFLPRDFDAELDAHTGDGRIHNELDVAASGADGNRRTVRGRLGAGGRQLRIRTGDGAIRLRML